jgi:small subunit ribosomal protein S12
MVTFSQYNRRHRRTKLFKSSTPKFEGSPFKCGIITRVAKVKPKKPNSAQRSVITVELRSGRFLLAYVPGFGHKLSKNSEVFIRGGRVPDMPGVRYHVLRNKKDLMTPETEIRSQRRSKFGLKGPNVISGMRRRQANKIVKRKKLKALGTELAPKKVKINNKDVEWDIIPTRIKALEYFKPLLLQQFPPLTK